MSEDAPHTSGARPLGLQTALIPGLDQLLDGAALIDVPAAAEEEARVVYLNAALLGLLGAAPGEHVGAPLSALLDDVALRDAFSVALKGGAATRFRAGLARQRGARTLCVSLSPALQLGDVSRWLCIVRDETRQHEQELERSEAERVAAAAVLAASVAHEINNPLASITSNLEWLASILLKLRPSAPPGGADELLTSVSAALVDALAGAERIESSVEHLALLAGIEYTQREVLEVRALLEAALRELEPSFGAGISIERHYDDVPPVYANERRLKQVFSALLLNAMQSIPLDACERRVTVRVRALGGVRVEIEDSGAGIPEQLEPRLFRPFVTSKPIGLAKGLGLYLAKKIVAGAGGRIGFLRLERGTLFIVDLPAAPGADDASKR